MTSDWHASYCYIHFDMVQVKEFYGPGILFNAIEQDLRDQMGKHGMPGTYEYLKVTGVDNSKKQQTVLRVWPRIWIADGHRFVVGTNWTIGNGKDYVKYKAPYANNVQTYDQPALTCDEQKPVDVYIDKAQMDAMVAIIPNLKGDDTDKDIYRCCKCNKNISRCVISPCLHQVLCKKMCNGTSYRKGVEMPDMRWSSE